MKILTLLAAFLICVNCGNKQDTIPSYTNQWEDLFGKYIQNPVDIRINKGLKPVVGHPAFDYQVAISVPVQNPQKDGLPNRTEEKQLKKLENILVQKLVEKKETVFAAVIKTDKRCDFIFYSGDKKSAKKKLESLGETINDYPLNTSLKKDNKWVTYAWFAQWKSEP
ncbi:MAG: DUF695 domain-containing protein [Chitinispirillaceae bacterium]